MEFDAARIPRDDGDCPTSRPLEIFSVSIENDVLLGSDDAYSNGFAFSWATDEVGVYPQDSFCRAWIDFWSFLPAIRNGQNRRYASWSLAQEIHTPNNIEVADPPPGVQPYAGLLYVDSTIFSMGEDDGHVFNLRLGTVGDSASAGPIQIEVHEFIGSPIPLGWETQLPNEPVVNVDYTYGWRAAGGGERSRAGWGWRVLPIVSASAGTYFTGASLSTYGEFGWNLTPAIGSGTLRGGLNNSSAVGAAPSPDWGCSLFLGVSGYAVGHYLPLDGTVFRNSRSVDSKPLVGQVSLGLTLRKGTFVLGVQEAFLTDTFEDQDTDNKFASFTLSWFL